MNTIETYLRKTSEECLDILSKNGRVQRKDCNVFAQATWDAYERGYMEHAKRCQKDLLTERIKFVKSLSGLSKDRVFRAEIGKLLKELNAQLKEVEVACS